MKPLLLLMTGVALNLMSCGEDSRQRGHQLEVSNENEHGQNEAQETNQNASEPNSTSETESSVQQKAYEQQVRYLSQVVIENEMAAGELEGGLPLTGEHLDSAISDTARQLLGQPAPGVDDGTGVGLTQLQR